MYLLKLIYLNTTFYVLLVLFTASYLPLSTLYLALLSLVVSRRQLVRHLRRCISWYGWTVVRIFPFPLVRIRYVPSGEKNLRPGRLYVCNHRSLSDAWLMGLLSVELIQIAKDYVLRLPVFGVVARLAGYLSPTDLSFEELSRKIRGLLEDGVSIITFPEGTRSGSTQIGQFHSVLFRIALDTRCPIVPICITGNERIPARGSLLLRPGRIRVCELPALRWEQYRRLSAYQLKNNVRHILAERSRTFEKPLAQAS
ncbi:MAG: 1-acyl-sn-glycerol-3-phosphate acyltransferase [Planctomycetes bacterium]|nr:1-acyl-sn-glycerol-3-phosphate acyltransferase [Planctomycetota bacterium]